MADQGSKPRRIVCDLSLSPMLSHGMDRSTLDDVQTERRDTGNSAGHTDGVASAHVAVAHIAEILAGHRLGDQKGKGNRAQQIARHDHADLLQHKASSSAGSTAA